MQKIPSQVDVLIVGAGPAGLAAATRLLGSGADVLLVDAARRIGYPLRCGEMTRETYFGLMGYEPRPSWRRWKLANFVDTIVIHRPRMENDIAGIVASRGVRVLSGCSLTELSDFDGEGRTATLVHEREKRTCRARVVIAADGISSFTAMRAGIAKRLPLEELVMCLAYRIRNADLLRNDRFRFDFDPIVKPSYFWVIPSGEREANVGVGIPALRGHRLRPLLDRFLRETDAIRGGTIQAEIVGGIPSTFPMKTPYADGLLVAGTAARFVDAVLGEGLRQAAFSGKTAAEMILKLNGRAAEAQSLSKYPEWLTQMTVRLEDVAGRRETFEVDEAFRK